MLVHPRQVPLHTLAAATPSATLPTRSRLGSGSIAQPYSRPQGVRRIQDSLIGGCGGGETIRAALLWRRLVPYPFTRALARPWSLGMPRAV